MTGFLVLLADLHLVGPHPLQQIAHRDRIGHGEPKMQKTARWNDVRHHMKRKIEPVAVAHDHGPFRKRFGASRVEPEIRRIELQAAPLIAHSKPKMTKMHASFYAPHPDGLKRPRRRAVWSDPRRLGGFPRGPQPATPKVGGHRIGAPPSGLTDHTDIGLSSSKSRLCRPGLSGRR